MPNPDDLPADRSEQFAQLLADVERLAAELRWDAIELGRTARQAKNDVTQRAARAAAERAGLYADLLADLVAKHRKADLAGPRSTPAAL